MAELQRAALAAYDKIICEKGEVTSLDMFIAGRDWQKEQMMKNAIEGEVIDKGDFIKFADGKYIDLNPTMGAEPFVKLEEGDKVKVIIIKE